MVQMSYHQPPKPTLITILHDPLGKFLPKSRFITPLDFFSRRFNLLDLYDQVVINVTQETNPDLIRVFRQVGYDVIVSPKSNLSRARRLAMAYTINNGITCHYHYCDFDRLMYWYMVHPDELKRTVRSLVKYDFVVYGRTEKAFNTHPNLQRLTEKLANKFYQMKTGNKYCDLLAASRSFSYKTMAYLCSRSTGDGVTVDLEWPLLMRDFHYIEVEGLSYESKRFDFARSFLPEVMLRINNLYQFWRFLLKW